MSTTPALLIFKPDAAYRRSVRAGIWQWLQARDDLELTGLRWFHAPRTLIEQHYDFLEGKPFFPWLVDFMSALPVIVGELEADPDDLERIRFDLGETQIQKARPGSLRERFGIYGGVNCLHLSDSAESGRKETALWSKHVEFGTYKGTIIEFRFRVAYLRGGEGELIIVPNSELFNNTVVVRSNQVNGDADRPPVKAAPTPSRKRRA